MQVLALSLVYESSAIDIGMPAKSW